MGSMQLAGMLETETDRETIMRWHLQYNHFPAVPGSMVRPCLEAVEAAEDDDWDRAIALPAGVTYRDSTSAPAWAIVEGHHLEGFIEPS